MKLSLTCTELEKGAAADRVKAASAGSSPHSPVSNSSGKWVLMSANLHASHADLVMEVMSQVGTCVG